MTAPLRGAIMVEGDGEDSAAPLLLNRLWQHLGLPTAIRWETPIFRHNNLKDNAFLEEQAKARWPELRRYAALMVIYDADFSVGGRNACPKHDGKPAAQALRNAKLPIPAAVVLAYPEFEHWIAACLPALAGQTVSDPATGLAVAKVAADCGTVHQSLAQRNGKGLVKRHLVPAKYEPAAHQAALTALLDFNYLQQSHIGGFEQPEQSPIIPAFGTLCRACSHIHANLGKPGAVYP